ncbi:MAG TPA: DinB family protein [Acidimicrobiia bacterium]|nr:DinB family protein [Acidimicrobiia bacterium]
MPITPDTKDWTWVLQRPCPDCGFAAAALDRTAYGERARAIAAAWREVLARDDVHERPNDETWSPLEYGCHVRDVFRICDGRLELMLREAGPTFPNWDQDATAIEDRYSEQQPARVADELAEWADRFADRYDRVDTTQWQRTGTRSDGARFTVESFGRYVIHDPMHHLWDVDINRT